ncbi:MAG TPA: hypothetical protein VNT79_00810 [Phycisphaerae bacterium]|nr:hypothetical protein [Phycisphaerae bacterium]
MRLTRLDRQSFTHDSTKRVFKGDFRPRDATKLVSSRPEVEPREIRSSILGNLLARQRFTSLSHPKENPLMLQMTDLHRKPPKTRGTVIVVACGK